jgi:2-polyprenyl-3-methyl-5-hydroxy-6-metoxy-1,4-benzoquinol methylase
MAEVVDRLRVFGETATDVERIAPGYFPQPFVAEHLARYRWAAKYVRGLHVLDVACGTGYGAGVLRAGGTVDVVSIDISADALNFGRARYDLQAVRADAQALPFAAGTFNAVVSFETIEHLRDPKQFLREVSRVLRGDGTLLLSTPNAEQGYRYNPYHLNEMTLAQLLELCLAEGFRALSILGQQWRLRGWVFDRVKGFRRFAALIQRSPMIYRVPPRLARPRYWCLRLRRTFLDAALAGSKTTAAAISTRARTE